MISKSRLAELRKHMKTCGHYCAWETKIVEPLIGQHLAALAVVEAAKWLSADLLMLAQARNFEDLAINRRTTASFQKGARDLWESLSPFLQDGGKEKP